jgi:hypothetical protein
MEVSGQLHAPAALHLEKSIWYSLCRRLGGPQSQSGRSDGDILEDIKVNFAAVRSFISIV